MPLRSATGRIWITDPTDTAIVFDTNERGFIPTNFVTGSVTIPQRVAQSIDGGQTTNVDTQQTITLATVHADANAVVGSFKVTTTDGTPQGVHNFGWFSAGGTYIHSQLPKTSIYNGVLYAGVVGGTSGYTFAASGGSLTLHERAVFRCTQAYSGFSSSMDQRAMTIEYKLYVGTI